VHRREHLHREERGDLHAAGLRRRPRGHDLGYEYSEANIVRSDLYTADEAFLSGTAAEIVPIRSVDDRELGDPGPITRAIQDVFFKAVKGEVPEYSSWNEHV
jgi:branched-chain amino acid aminotransferase